MKKKKYIALIAALTLSSAFVLNGCSLALPGEETKISTGAELSAEQEILTRWKCTAPYPLVQCRRFQTCRRHSHCL